MTQRDRKNRIPAKYGPLVSMLMLVLVMIATYFMVFAALSQKKYDVSVGAAAPETIRASRTITDVAATNALKENARKRASKAYKIDQNKIDELTAGAQGYLSALVDVRSQARAQLTPEELGAAVAWEERLDQNQKLALMAMSSPALSEEELFALLGAGDGQLELLKNIVLPKLSTALSAGLTQEGVESVREACKKEVSASSSLSAGLKSIGNSLLDAYIGATFVLDEEQTLHNQELAGQSVENVIIEKGDPIVEEGESVSASQLALLEELGLVKTGGSDIKLAVGIAVLVLVAFAVFTVYLIVFRREVFINIKEMAIISVLLALTLLLALLNHSIGAGVSPALFAVLLAALLVCERCAIAVSVLLAVMMGLMANVGGSLGFSSISVMLPGAASGITAVFALRKTQSRSSIIAASAIGGAAGALCILAMYLISDAALADILVDSGWLLGSCLLCALLVVGSLTIWENLFDIATSARLHELLNTNQPLMKQLMMEAPGTYQHSMSVASLSEAAAERIGANSLLARVGASYHDVGKLRRPLYFKENQKPNENIHDSLPPAESASTIIAHQRDGVTLLSKHRFPSAVVRIAGEHHGNSLVAYFYYKAAREDKSVGQKPFRYTGNRPSTKESAIVMLADSCEAAVRSLGDCTRETREEMIHKVIWGKLKEDDNMLCGAPLTFQEISEIERSFQKTFNGIMHDRIEYPEQEGK